MIILLISLELSLYYYFVCIPYAPRIIILIYIFVSQKTTYDEVGQFIDELLDQWRFGRLSEQSVAIAL